MNDSVAHELFTGDSVDHTKNHNFHVFGLEQKVVRRKIMPVRGGITSRIAVFFRFMPTQDYDLSVIFETPSPFLSLLSRTNVH